MSANDNFKIGWAVLESGGININTVSDTRRAAIVNWLCVCCNLMVLACWTDAQIEEAWERNRGFAMAVRVRIAVEEPIL